MQLDKKGLLWGFTSYALWGFFPLYWHLLVQESSLEILAHRMFWAFVFYILIFIFAKRASLTTLFTQSKRDLLLSTIASLLLSFNWGLYIYAVNNGHVLESSLAYFINPILNVVVGVLLFKESFPLVLRLAVLLAGLGVASRVLLSPVFPWISLGLAISFCAYGITKKVSQIPATISSALEGSIGALPALAAIFYFCANRTEPIQATTWMLFIFGGVVTGLPLFLFSYAAQRIPYSVMGMLQFIAPTLQFAVGVLVFHEAFEYQDLVSFGLIWAGVVCYLSYQVRRMYLSRFPAGG